MPPSLNVYALPKLVEPEDLTGGTVVVIDVLRASTSIIYALEAGAAQVIPCREVQQARAVARQFPAGEVLLGGERGGLPIDGFDLGNSPGEYSAERVAGKTIVLTTTNGTRAIEYARRADRILIGAFVNASAIVAAVAGQEQVHLLCAGTGGEISRDDLLLAGMLAERVQRLGGLSYEQNDWAILARQTWLDAFASPKAPGGELPKPQRLAAELLNSRGGRNLAAIALEADILSASRIDLFTGVADFDPKNTRIRLAQGNPESTQGE